MAKLGDLKVGMFVAGPAADFGCSRCAVIPIGRHASRVRVEPTAIIIQELGFRWGSCGKGGRIYFHWQSILLSPHIVDYIVVHELVHLREAHHTTNFWRAVERSLPDCEQRRRWLAERGQEFIL